MIIDSLANAGNYYGVHKDFEEVFTFFKGITPDTEPGKYVLREDEVWVNVSKVPAAKAEDKSVFEAHHDFIDIQLIFQGEEIFGYSNVDRLDVKKPYSAEADIEFLEGYSEICHEGRRFLCVIPPGCSCPQLEKAK